MAWTQGFKNKIYLMLLSSLSVSFKFLLFFEFLCHASLPQALTLCAPVGLNIDGGF